MTGSGNRFDIIAQLGSLRRYARSLTRDESDAEDLVQDTLIRAYERRTSFRGSGNLRAWLLSILHNTFVDRSRSRRAEAGRIEALHQVIEDRTDPPQEHVVRLAQVRRAFFDLPEDQRAAIHLVAIEGLSYQEAADTLGIPLGTLMSRIGRARQSLRTLEADTRHSGTHLKVVGGRDE